MKCIHELFEIQAAENPDAAALEFGTERLSYRELDQRAERLARRLRGLGAGPETLVALFLERSAEMVVGLLGVLKAGAAYVPLDPVLLPEKRLTYMLEDAKPLIVLTQRRLQSSLPPHAGLPVLLEDETAEEAPAADPRPVRPDDLAYVIYTSGSTGQPKGVEIRHGAVVNLLESMRRRPGLSAGDRMLALTTLAFDIAVLEIFLPLACGACVCIAGSDTARDGVALTALIGRAGVTVMQATPATMQMLLDAGWEGAPGLKILCGGEAWSAGLATRLLGRCGSLWNMYGPTETTVWSAVAKVEEGRPVVIGRPIANTRFYVLDSTLQLVPVGVPGELFIGGDGLARGYLNRPELTAERFIPDPFAGGGALMYRTGDSVRRLPNGTLEFLGRLDHQVKIRGHRIELGEIESALASHPGIERSVAMVHEAAAGPRLAAYFIAAEGHAVAASELREFLGERLPSYMVPSALVPVAAFPLTPSGKIDRKALPPPDAPAAAGPDFAAPATPAERQIAQIWCDMLKLERVGLNDNFFDLGGHSLLALRTINEINKALAAQLNVPDFFRWPTVGALASACEKARDPTAAYRVVRLYQGGSGLPVYFMGARPDEYRLAELIAEDRTIFVIDALIPAQWVAAVAAKDQTVPTIEQIGKLFGEALLAHAGKTRCIIAGYSLGGKIALEAARVFRQAGGSVALVLLVDSRAFTWSTASKLATVWRSALMVLGGTAFRTEADDSYAGSLRIAAATGWRLLRWQVASIPTGVHYRLSVIRHRRNAARDVMPEAAPSGYFDDQGRPIDMWVVYRLAHLSGKAWRPRPVDCPGVLIRATALVDMLPGYDRGHGWSGLFAGGFEILQTEGDHLTIFNETHALTLGRLMKAVLNRYGGGGATAGAPARQPVPDQRAPGQAAPLPASQGL